MDRIIVTPGQIPLDTDVLNTNKNTMLALGRAFAAIFGTNTIANGLAVSAAVTGLTVNVAPGSVYSLQNVDNTPYGTLPADETDTIVKQGILASIASLACPAPTTAGFSVNFLIEACFQEVDGAPVLLPFYNADNPAQPYNGPNNDQAQINTLRQAQVGLIAKAGIAATTGTQLTPSVDAGYVPLAVVTIAYGQTTITAGNIVATQQSVIATSLLQAIQSSSFTYGKDVGVANACVVNLTPAITALTDGMEVSFSVAAANTGNTTLNLSGTGANTIVTSGFQALIGTEFSAGARATVMWDAATTQWVLLNCTGGVQQGVTAPQFDASTRIATTAFVQRALGNNAGQVNLTGGGALTASDCGFAIVNSSGGTVTLPQASTCGAGSVITVTSATVASTIAHYSGDTLTIPSGGVVASVSCIGQGSIAFSRNAGGTGWNIGFSDGALQWSPYFGAQLASSGYQKFPTGAIVQWGGFASSGTTAPNASVTFPIAFPNGAMAVIPAVVGVTIGSFTAQVYAKTLTSFSLNVFAGSALGSAIGGYWFAVGY